MATLLRLIKTGMVATVALFFTMVAYGNIVDYDSNWQFVQHVLAMDTTFKNPAISWRAITNTTLQHLAYNVIIFWQVLTAICCWLGVILLSRHLYSPATHFERAKKWAYLGLFLGFLLYMLGFIIIGGEWFEMWQSKEWNGQAAAGLFLTLILLIMLFIKNEHDRD